MKSRCNNQRHAKWKHYGGRGIRVCARWQEFMPFLEDVGCRPSDKHSLDRIDNNRDYELGNVRWATATQQNRNRRSVVWEEHEPAQVRWLVVEGYTQTEVARFFGVNSGSVNRIVTGARW